MPWDESETHHYDIAVKRFGEGLIFQVVDIWERHQGLFYKSGMMGIEERWARFIHMTEQTKASCIIYCRQP